MEPFLVTCNELKQLMPVLYLVKRIFLIELHGSKFYSCHVGNRLCVVNTKAVVQVSEMSLPFQNLYMK